MVDKMRCFSWYSISGSVVDCWYAMSFDTGSLYVSQHLIVIHQTTINHRFS